MGAITVKNVTKVYPGNIVSARNVSFEVKDGEFFILVGPSGCGKSTVLRMIAGLEEITDGEIYIDGRLINDVPPKDRDIAMVFQNYALYPHMKVYDNMAFGLRLRGCEKSEIDARVNEAAEILGIANFLDRYPKALSGGQRQRVAVGRAIVRKPKVFLFDEPLSNLDAKVRVTMRMELKKIQEKLGVTTVYVTHDQTEAITMSDRICVIKDGIVQQVDEPLVIYDSPKNRFVAGFIGSPPMNFFDVKIIDGAASGRSPGIWLEADGWAVKAGEKHRTELEKRAGRLAVLGIRPENIFDKLYAQGYTQDNTVKAKVYLVEPMGSETYLHLTAGGNMLVARFNAHTTVKENDEIEVVLDMDKVHLFDKESGVALL
jgi:multiple sugar transport system ATP-binding protein